MFIHQRRLNVAGRPRALVIGTKQMDVLIIEWYSYTHFSYFCSLHRISPPTEVYLIPMLNLSFASLAVSFALSSIDLSSSSVPKEELFPSVA